MKIRWGFKIFEPFRHTLINYALDCVWGREGGGGGGDAWGCTLLRSTSLTLFSVSLSSWMNCFTDGICTRNSFTSKSNAPLLCRIIDKIDDEKAIPCACEECQTSWWRPLYDFSTWCMLFPPIFRSSIFFDSWIYWTICIYVCTRLILMFSSKICNFDVNCTIFSRVRNLLIFAFFSYLPEIASTSKVQRSKQLKSFQKKNQMNLRYAEMDNLSNHCLYFTCAQFVLELAI